MSRNWLIALGVVMCLLGLGIAILVSPGFAGFMNNSNYGGAIIGIVLPGGFIYLWTHYLHRQHRAEMRDLHESIHAKLDAHAQRLARLQVHAVKHEAQLNNLHPNDPV